nr:MULTISPECIES: C2H2-type zinc finger protein [unclassified Sulfolobus]
MITHILPRIIIIMVKRIVLKCEVCGETFSSNSLYYQHKALQHSNYKPIVREDGYECPVCHEKRRGAASMLTHIGLHHATNKPLRVELQQ